MHWGSGGMRGVGGEISIPHEQLVALVTIKMRSHEQQKHAIPHEQLYKFYFEFALYFNAHIVAQVTISFCSCAT